MQPYPYKYLKLTNDQLNIKDTSITTDSLFRVFGNLSAVYDLNLIVKKNEIFSLLGVNGAGKTTTFKMLTSQLYPTKGTIYIQGLNLLSSQFYNIRKFLGYCPQDSIIFDFLTVKEHLQYYASIKGIPQEKIPTAVEEQLNNMDLNEYKNKVASKLSGGNKRKLCVSIALIGNPPLVLLDEPTTGIDPKIRRKLWTSLIKAKEYSTILLTTHSMEEAEALSDRVAIMVNGTIRCQGTCPELKLKYGEHYLTQAKFREPTDEQIKQIISNYKLDSSKYYSINEIVPMLKEVYKSRLDLISMSNLYGAIYSSSLNGNAIAMLLYVEIQLNSLLSELGTLGRVEIVEFANVFAKLKVSKGNYSISQIFKIFEEKKAIIETYSVMESTLEQVFGKFALDSEKEKRGIMHD